MTHSFECKATWRGGLDGCGTLACSALETNFSAPALLNGSGQGTNPEELLLAASSTCFLITLSALLNQANKAVSCLSLQSEITVAAHASYSIKSIHHQLRVTFKPGSQKGVIDQVKGLTQRAEQLCMVSKAIRPNVSVRVTPEFIVGHEYEIPSNPIAPI